MPESRGGENDNEERKANGQTFDAIVLTSPTYEGAVRPVAAWAAFARQMNALLIIDEAHGAHLPFHPYFPSSATANGADLVVQSLHKTLPALTQTALLHNVSGRVDGRKIQAFLDIYETSSPSYLLLASITSTLHGMADAQKKTGKGQGEFRRGYAVRSGNIMEMYVQRLRMLRDRLGRLRNFGLLGGGETFAGEEFPGIPAGTPIDPGKLVILCRGRLDGPALYRKLRGTYHLQPEMCGLDYVLCMTSVADTEEGFERLAAAMEALDREMPYSETKADPSKAGKENNLFGGGLPPVACPIYEAAEAEAEDVPIRKAAGRISAGYILRYPPDVPIIVPGEVFTEENIREILAWRRQDFTIIGVDAQDCVAVIS